MHYLQKLERDEIATWLVEQDLSVFGTLKFTDGTQLSREHGDKIVRTFFNALDRTYFGHAVQNIGMRQPRVVFAHKGISGTNLHYHFLARPFTDPKLFTRIAAAQWATMSPWTMGASDTLVERIRNKAGAASYVLHEYPKHGSDCLCLSASSLQPHKRSVRSFRNIAQLRRLLKMEASILQDEWKLLAG